MNNKLRKLQSMNFKTILKYVFFPEEQANRFAKINFRPDLYTVLRNSPYLIIKGSRFRKAYLLDYRAGRVANNKIIPINLPPIELLICSTEKDFFLLNKVLVSAVANSYNQVSKITILVPEKQVQTCRNILKNVSINLEIINENTYLSEMLRTKIRRNFPNRYGWVVQQLLILSYVFSSESQGVLQIDSDTVLTNKISWLSNEKIQILNPTAAYHKPYYDVLKKLVPELCQDQVSFVSHHMLYQPEILRQIFEVLKISNLDSLFDRVLKYCDKEIESPFCLDYELYAQYIYHYCREKIVLSKFCNYSYKLSENSNLEAIECWISEQGNEYKSASFHHYS